MKSFINYIAESRIKSKNNLAPLDETECINLQVNDELLEASKIQAYNIGQTVIDQNGKEQPVNPKKFPEKAIDIIFPVNDLLIEVFLDSESKKWDSNFKYDNRCCKLSPEQMGQFFNTNFYSKLQNQLKKTWPLSDKLYGELYDGILNKEMKVGYDAPLTEDVDDKDNDTGANDRKYSKSGRKLMNFGNMGVKASTAKFTCWPDLKKVYNWSTWKDWKKIKPLCRMRFEYTNGHEYGISISAIGKDYDLRGFRSYVLVEQPPLQWLSKEENNDLMKLDIFNKFIKHCIKKIQKYLNIPTEELYDKMNNKVKITPEEIDKTKSVIRKTLNEIIRKKQSDSFKWAK